MASLKDFITATLNSKGASFNLITGQLNPSRGYMVAIKGHEKLLPWPMTAKQLQKEVSDYIGEKHTILTSGIAGDRHYIGSWVDRKNGNLVLDVSVNDLQGIHHALGMGLQEGQRFIWDNDRQMSILVN